MRQGRLQVRLRRAALAGHDAASGPSRSPKLRLQKIFNLIQDPFERADITSNTFWDWQLNHVGQVYGVMDDVAKFVATFKEFPPRSFPPSFVPATILEEQMDDIKDNRARAGQRAQSIDKIRSGVNQMIEQQLQQRGVK